jgi:hypothetical protein
VSAGVAMASSAPVVRPEAAQSSTKLGGGSDLSPRCHPVPAFHPERHALLDHGLDPRLMTGPGEGI